MPPLSNSASPKEANVAISQIYSYTQHRIAWIKMRKMPTGESQGITYKREKKPNLAKGKITSSDSLKNRICVADFSIESLALT